MLNCFTMEELTYSATALERKWRNATTVEVEENLSYLRSMILNPARAFIGSPIYVTSCFRTPKLNRAIGGAPNSQHMTGQAVDITTKRLDRNKRVFEYIRDNLVYDQLIWENGGCWIHVSYVHSLKGLNRMEVLEIDHGRVLFSGSAAMHKEKGGLE